VDPCLSFGSRGNQLPDCDTRFCCQKNLCSQAPASLCHLSVLRTTMPKDKSEKKEKKDKTVKGLPEANDVEMGDADQPKVDN